MKLFEDFLKENKNDFDTFLPEEKHFDRFKNKLERKNNVKSFDYRIILKVAVVLIPIFVVIFMLSNNNTEISYAKDCSINQYSAELTEIEYYFNKKIDSKLAEFENLECFVNEDDKKQIISDLNKIDNSINYLTKELEKTANNEKIFNAIITNYQSKEKILNQVLTQIKQNC